MQVFQQLYCFPSFYELFSLRHSFQAYELSSCPFACRFFLACFVLTYCGCSQLLNQRGFQDND